MPERNGHIMNILVTGGAGYIGSTIVNALVDRGHTPIILDNLITGHVEFTNGKIFYNGDIANRELVRRILKEHAPVMCAIHCAALTVVPESVVKPYEYYHENVYKSLELFKALRDYGCHRVVFSSSAALYDDAEDFVVTEDSPLRARSPYARTKQMVEMILQDMCAAYPFEGLALRYFNPIGADPMLRSGSYIHSAVLGKLIAAAHGQESKFYLTGVDWPTRDGSAIRDYIHVWDLAMAHVCAVERFENALNSHYSQNGYLVINLGVGDGVTVWEFVRAFREIYNKPFNVEEAPPRSGDVAGAYTLNTRAKELLGWQPKLGLKDGIRDALRWSDANNF